MKSISYYQDDEASIRFKEKGFTPSWILMTGNI